MASYLTPFTFVSVSIFFILLLIILRLIRQTKKLPSDVVAIAGDDVWRSQLDLARAYIEMGQKKPAKEILSVVKKQGTAAQKKEAKQLCALL